MGDPYVDTPFYTDPIIYQLLSYSKPYFSFFAMSAVVFSRESTA
jgi:hypothetical protein